MWKRWRSRRIIRLVWPSLVLPTGPPTLSSKGSQWVSLQAPPLLPRCMTRSSAPGSCSVQSPPRFQPFQRPPTLSPIAPLPAGAAPASCSTEWWMPPKGREARRARRLGRMVQWWVPEVGTVPTEEPKCASPLGPTQGGTLSPFCTLPSPPRGAPSSAGLGAHVARRYRGRARKRRSGWGQEQEQGRGAGVRAVGQGLELERELTQGLLSVRAAKTGRQKRPLLPAKHGVRAGYVTSPTRVACRHGS